MADTSAPKTRILAAFQALGVAALLVGVILAGAGLASAGFASKDLWKSVYFGWMFWTTLTLGCTGLALLHHVVRAKWTTALFRVWEAGGGWQMLLLMLVIFLAIALGGGREVWPWMDPAAASDAKIAAKSAYLNFNFFVVRGVVFFGVLAWAMSFLSGLLAKEEATGDKKLSDRRNWVAPPMLAVYVLVINFAMTDWGMSLDPHWYSTIYGVWMMIGMAIFALSFAIITVASQANKAPFAGVTPGPLLKDIGHMLLALSMVWAYFSFSQYLIIWSGNMAEFTPYYLARSKNLFNLWGGANIIGSFVFPFLYLVGPQSPGIKLKPMGLVFVAAWCLVFRFVDFHYIISPSLRPGHSVVPALSDLGMLLAFGGVWLVVFSYLARMRPLTTASHPYQVHAEKEASHALA